MTHRNLEEQVTRILDEGSGRSRTVIVRMKSTNEDRDALIRMSSRAMRHRRLSISARDILPGSAAVLRDEKELSPYQRRKLKGRGASSVSQVAAAQLPVTTKAGLRKSARQAMRPLLSHEVVRRSLAAPTRKAETRSKRGVFWASGSVLLKLGKDELRRVATEVADIGDIYPNRALAVPGIVESKSLPATVRDNKSSAWGINATGALAAWGAYGARGSRVKVAVLDTGIDATHPDLAGGKVSDWAEFDFDGREVIGSQPHDSDRHGTHVAGTIVGGNASGKWIGMAPEARVAAALVLDGARGGTDAQVLAGIDWALQKGAHVINMSLGGLTLGPEVPNTYTEAIVTCLRAGVPVVTAIGNEGSQTTGSPGNDLFAFAVGASDHRDLSAGFSGGRTQVIRESNFIREELLPLPYSKPELSAPGVAIESSVPGEDWAAFNGTSMATPHVAGAVALLLSATGLLSGVAAEERAFLIQDLLIGAVEELGESGQDHRYGFGRLDVLRAIGFAREAGF